MPKGPRKSKKGKSKKGKSKKGLTKTIVKKAKRAAKQLVARRGVRGNRKRTKKRVGIRKRPAGLIAKKQFSMDYACFKGRDYVTTLQFSGPNPDGQQILEGPGQVIFKTQLQPWKMVANGRLARCMALFEKWRPKSLTFRLRSGMPGGMNAGTVLAVYEPNCLEKLPPITLGSDLPDRTSLSIYEAHSNAKILQVDPNNKQKDGNTDFSVRVDLQTGPFGGWFFFDSANVIPIGESSFGQFMIMVQLPMNCLGSSGVYKTNTFINWADLILDYEIECSVANDEPVDGGPGPNTIQATHNLSIGDGYSTFGQASGSQDLIKVFASASQFMTQAVDDFESTFVVASGQASIAIPQITGNGLVAFLVMDLAAKSDAGTTGSGFLTPTAFTSIDNQQGVSIAGTVHSVNAVNVANGSQAGIYFFNFQANSGAVGPNDIYVLTPGAWTVGAGGSATATASASAHLYALECPDSWKENGEMKMLSLENPKVQKLLQTLLLQHPDFTPLQVKQSHPVELKRADKPLQEVRGVAHIDSDDDWDVPKTLHFDFSEARLRTQPPTPSSESDERKAPAKTSRPSSLKSSGGKDKEKL